MPRPHKLDLGVMADFFNTTEVEAASATTADGTQRKRLLRRGNSTYVVTRRYLGSDESTQEVYEGPSLPDAITAYNRLG